MPQQDVELPRRASDYWAQHYETVFCIFLAALAYLWRGNSRFIYPQIFHLVAALLALNLSAGLALKRWPSRQWICAAVICANNAVIAAMTAYSGGRESDLWVLYLLPISAACLLLERREVAWVAGGAVSFNAAYFLLATPAWSAADSFELSLKSGILVFCAALTWRVGQRDRSARDALREQSLRLEQSQKMEAVGTLAGGIAHDFNNILTAIMGSTHFLLESIPEADSRFPDVREIRNAAARAAALTHQLLAFSRRQTLQPKVVDLNMVVKDMEGILRRVIREDISFATALARDLHPVKADPDQFGQVLLNLAVNARDAMPAGGSMRIATANSLLREPEGHGAFSVPPGAYAALSVSDTGTGMDAETMTRIFEPFFTTKERGRGTGLGLSMVYGVVKQSGGYILVSSQAGRGTTFRILLPRTREPLDPAGQEGLRMPAVMRNETVLLAEDDPQVRALAHRVLAGRGYTVLDAEDGARALEAAGRHPGRIGLLVTDVVMPGLSGPELARRVQAARPETKVLFMSGYTDRTLLEHEVFRNNLPFLPKPFTPADLLRKAGEVLGRAGGKEIRPAGTCEVSDTAGAGATAPSPQGEGFEHAR